MISEPTPRAELPGGSALPDAVRERWAPLREIGAWRVWDSGAATGAENMALDAALLDEARASGVATLRLYTWTGPTLSLGRHERARGRFEPARLRAEGVDIVRRPTGGRALLHHRELTYAIAAPSGGGALRARYAAINALLVTALAALGVPVEVAAGRRTARPGSTPCFAEPSDGELVVDGRKLVASAQVEDRGAFLQHGSLLLDDDQPRIAALTADGAPLRTQATALRTLLDEPVDASRVARALHDALAALLAPDLQAGRVTFTPGFQSISGSLDSWRAHHARFSDPAWTWSR